MIARETFTDRDATSRSILAMLPEWFGIPAAREGYIRHAASAPMLIAEAGDRVIGYVSLAEHHGTNCEIHSMGVHPDWHRKGVGRSLIGASTDWAKARGFRWLSVKTLSDRHPDPNYAGTRVFYRAMGFLPFEELPSLWGEDLPCLVLIRSLDN